jgi:hypothetical protein
VEHTLSTNASFLLDWLLGHSSVFIRTLSETELKARVWNVDKSVVGPQTCHAESVCEPPILVWAFSSPTLPSNWQYMTTADVCVWTSSHAIGRFLIAQTWKEHTVWVRLPMLTSDSEGKDRATRKPLGAEEFHDSVEWSGQNKVYNTLQAVQYRTSRSSSTVHVMPEGPTRSVLPATVALVLLIATRSGSGYEAIRGLHLVSEVARRQLLSEREHMKTRQL